MEPLLPHDDEAERMVLGAILLDEGSEALGVVQELWRGENCFYRSSHRLIYTVMLDMMRADIAIEPMSLSGELRRLGGDLSDARGSAYISELYGNVLTVSSVKTYGVIVWNNYRLRKIAEYSEKTLQEVQNGPENVSEFMLRKETELLGITRGLSVEKTPEIKEIINQTLSIIEANGRGETTYGLQTGIKLLDDAIIGLRRSEMIVLAGLSSHGKSALAVNILLYNAMAGIPVAYFDLETSPTSAMMRLLSMDAHIPLTGIQSGRLRDGQYHDLITSAARLSAVPLSYEKGPMTITEVKSKARKLKAEKGMGLLVIDYLQKIASHSRRENRQLEVSDQSREIANLAQELDIPIIALSQFNRAVAENAGGEPHLHNLRESGSIENDCSLAIILHRPEQQLGYSPEGKPIGYTKIKISKNKSGPCGEFSLLFDGATLTFREEHSWATPQQDEKRRLQVAAALGERESPADVGSRSERREDAQNNQR